MADRYTIAVGLHYDEERPGAPVVGVKSECGLAERVVRIARRMGIPIMEDPALARAMNALPLDEEIPEELFKAVAVVLNQVEAKLRA